MYDWKMQFSRHTLEQGKTYFEQGKVIDLQETEGVWTAGVLEKQRYNVRLSPRKEKEGYLMSCRCPMASSGAKCKHMAAVFYAMEGVKRSRKVSESAEQNQEASESEKRNPAPSEDGGQSRPVSESEKRSQAASEDGGKNAPFSEDGREFGEFRQMTMAELMKQRENPVSTEGKATAEEEVSAAKKADAVKESGVTNNLAAINKSSATKEKDTVEEQTAAEEPVEASGNPAGKTVETAADPAGSPRDSVSRKSRKVAKKREAAADSGQPESSEPSANGTKKAESAAETVNLPAENRLTAELQPSAGGQVASESAPGYIVLNRQEEPEERERPKDYLAPYPYFMIDSVKKSMHLTEQKLKKSEKLLAQGAVQLGEINSGYCDESPNVALEATGVGQQGKRQFPLHILIGQKEVIYAECGCDECARHYYYRYYRRDYCAYLAALAELLREEVQKKNYGDTTDRYTAGFMSAVYQRRANHVMSDAIGKSGSLTLLPRLCKKNGDLSLSFKVGEGRLFVVKDLSEFYDNVRESRSSTYGSGTTINHRLENFTEDGKRWIEYIGRIVREELDFNRRLIEADRYSRQAAFKGGDLAMFGWRLDELWQMLGEDGVDYEDRDGEKKEKKKLYPREKNPNISMTIRKNRQSNKHSFHGVEADCRMPLIYEGNRSSYFIQGEELCRMEEEFARKIQTLADFSRGGILHFEVGRNRLGQFYHDVLPQLEDVVEIREENSEEIEAYLPPKPRFVFYLDAERKDMSCRIEARYGKETFSLLKPQEEADPIRDRQQEEEIRFRATQFFPNYIPEREELTCGGDEELMYRVLEEGVDTLLALGEVQCTQRFRNTNLGKRMRVSVGVSVSRDLLNLEISTQDVPPAELLDILRSYRAKKKYYRLKSGDFLSLEDQSLEALDEMLATLRLSPKELLKGNVKVPLYRALYLDKLLEKNEEIYSNRDSHFREIAKNFKAVKDADFDVPESLRKVLRGYQRLGYRWMRLLEAYQLGGILADDMGLGKTLQAITVLLAAKQEGRIYTSLIVTPASLVYNWGEELNRFAPELTCCFITGDQAERAQKLENYRYYDVIVTSYDLLKRDIAGYEDKEFHYQIIDEAQYIKNHTTAAAKAVKGIKSKVRYALTGTPVENRLSELWSIFDYLMPGYLYGYDVFRSDFEGPIVKNEDGAALERLQRMVSPFILRRLKEEVLRDLPEKLEENRYVKFEGEQQTLYDAQVVKMRRDLATQDAESFRRDKIRILAELMRLRQICCDPGLCFENYAGGSAKLDACVDLIRSAVEGGHKLLLFSQFTSMLSLLADRLSGEGLAFYTITGETPKEKRLQLVKAFNEDETPVFLISLKAGGVGLNLIGADVVIHYDPWWNVAVQNQATDRAHRIGQTKKVVVYRLIAKNTIEEKIQKLQESKKALSDQIVQGNDGQLGTLSREEFLSLLE
ncbi:MAG: SNF2 helicase associated domain-containing protein [Roseburia sp.]|nr:SNF2 helicase associated domain-containing protein [Roseburia sp.]MCM1096469.1 SNF2 helicase associated domain-containing protein [Ruminococcus flavefaciens]